jgi:HTH-type transcriptional regulator/antitoxin HigA
MSKKGKQTTPFMAVPPGATLKEELVERGITQRQFAQQIGMQPSHLSELISGKRTVTLRIAQKLQEALGIPAKLWLNLQTNYELDLASLCKAEEKEQLVYSMA